jgi:hypothetical protein
MNIYIVITFAGMLGIIGHSLRTINAINKRNSYNDLKFVFHEYWKNDKLSLITSVFSFGLLLFCSSEFVNLNDLESVDNSHSLKERLFNFRIAAFIKTAGVIAGWFSQSIVYSFMGVTEKRLKAFFDKDKVDKP